MAFCNTGEQANVTALDRSRSDLRVLAWTYSGWVVLKRSKLPSLKIRYYFLCFECSMENLQLKEMPLDLTVQRMILRLVALKGELPMLANLLARALHGLTA